MIKRVIVRHGESIWNYENIFTGWTRILIYQIMELQRQNKKVKFLGIITLKEIKDVPRRDWDRVKVLDILVPHNKKWEVSADSDVMKAFELMIKEDKDRIIFMENDTTQTALEVIRSSKLSGNIFYCYTTDKEGKLVGIVPLRTNLWFLDIAITNKHENI